MMMRETLRFLASPVRGLQSAVYVLALFAVLSAVLGLLRDRIFAHVFGAGTTLDIYNAAFQVPDFLFVAMGALVSVYVLIPELSRRTEASERDYIDTVIVGFSILSIILCGGAAILAPYIFSSFFPKLAALGRLPELILLSRIMLIQPILFGFSNILGAITQSRHRYVLYALSPLLYNCGIILGAVLLYPVFGVAGLALGVVLGALLHAGIQLPSIISDGYFHRLPKLREPQALLSTAMLSFPRALALSMSQLAFFGLTALAGLLPAGSIAIFRFAFNLQAVPLSIIGASYSVAAFPGLSAALAAGERQRFIAQLATAARHIVFWSLPATALIIVLRAHIVRVILGSGAFDWTDTRLTAACFALFGLSLTAQGLTLLVVRAYYAAGRTFVPFFVSLGTAVATGILGAASVGALQIEPIRVAAAALMRLADVPGVPVLALAFAYALSSIGGAIVLVLHFERRFGGLVREAGRSWLEALAAAVAAGFAAYLALHVVGPIALSSTLLTVFARGFAGGIAGIAAAAAVYYLVGNREFRETVQTIKNRMPGLFGKPAASLTPEVVAAAEEQIVP